MLLSLVITLQPLQPAILPAGQGRALAALFLDLVRRVDPLLANNLHAGDGLRPYTISDLQDPTINRRGELLLFPDQPLWWRATSLTEPLSQTVLEKVVPLLRECGNQNPLILDKDNRKVPFAVLGVAIQAEEHPWAGRDSFENLAQVRLLRPDAPDPLLRLQFASPTTFHSQGLHQPFPLPEWVFCSWLERWNAFAPIGLPAEMREFAKKCIAVNRFRIQTAVVRHDVPLIGFTGECSFRILEPDPYWLRLADTLAAFAFYCGTGHKTTWGLGQTRCLGDVGI
jgi:CRISPR-associated endoribonuclease Cas6